MAFTDQEKARIKHHLGYPDWTSLSNGIQLGFPAGGQHMFLVEQAFNRMTPDAEDSIRIDLCQCEDIERQMAEARRRFAAAQIGTLRVNDNEPNKLRQELTYWKQKLADDLGCPINLYSLDEMHGTAGGRCARVIG